MFYIFRTRYRIVKDNYSGYESQFRYWWMPFYLQMNGSNASGTNTHSTVEAAEALINTKRYTYKVVKQVV